jgi:hypothetical protein
VTRAVAAVFILSLVTAIGLIYSTPRAVADNPAATVIETYQAVAVHLPLAIVVLSAFTAALVTSGWIGRWWPRTVTLQYATLAVAAVALVPLLAGWHLIGWGVS